LPAGVLPRFSSFLLPISESIFFALINGWMDGWISDGGVGWIDELIVDGLNGWNHGWVEWMDGWMDWIDCGWIHGWVEWMD
jgi:hypothetical protein